MKEHEHNLDDFLKALKNDPAPAQPPQELVDSVLQKLKAAGEEPQSEIIKEKITILERINAMKTLTKLAAAAVIILAVLSGIIFFNSSVKKPHPEIVKQQLIPETKNAAEREKETKEDLEAKQAQAKLDAQLQNIVALYTASDVNGLMAVLSQGQLQSQLAAAYFIGDIGDLRAVELLEKLSERYGGNDPNNLFAAAAEKIKSRANTAQSENKQETQATTVSLESDHLDINIDGNDSNNMTGEEGIPVFGQVINLDGKPAEGAEVILSTPSQNIYIQNGKNIQKQNSTFVKTGTDGRFSFPPQTELYRIVVLCEKGCADVTAEQVVADSNIVIEAWGLVEGVLVIGSKPGAGEEIAVDYGKYPEPNFPQVFYVCVTVTDANGYFVLDKLPLGKAHVAHRMKLGESTHDSHSVPIEVKAGQAVYVTIGGMGRPIIGKIAAPADYNEPIDCNRGNNRLILKQQQSPVPEEGQPSQYLVYPFGIESDGSFRVEDVPSGQYELQINLHEKPKDGSSGYGPIIGNVNYEFEVTEMPGGRSDEPLDIGTLELKIKN
ncbi:MAG: hypothetical protein NTW55_02315 [Planctomycetota bacterium]|nr:hypothetical protein [Planctomycetota bacterium]